MSINMQFYDINTLTLAPYIGFTRPAQRRRFFKPKP